MRWGAYVGPKLGDKREVTRFLFLPVTLNGETRWWEWARVEQEYRTCYYDNGEQGWMKDKWVNLGWLEMVVTGADLS